MTQIMQLRTDGDMMRLTLAETLHLGDILAQTGYFKNVRSAGQAVAAILYGRELGIGPMSSLLGISIIEGKPAPGANLMAALIKRSGRYNYRVQEWTDRLCRIEFSEHGEPCGVASFSWDEAQQAGVTSKDNWRKYPKAMLFARAMSQGARAYCADVFGGAPVYSPEELGAEVTVDDSGEMQVLTAPALPAPAPEDADAGADAKTRYENEVAQTLPSPAPSVGQAQVTFLTAAKAAGYRTVEARRELIAATFPGVPPEILTAGEWRTLTERLVPAPAPPAEAPTIPTRTWEQPAPTSPVVNGLPVGGQATAKQIAAIYAIGRHARGKDQAAVDAECAARYADRRPDQLSKVEAGLFLDALKGQQVGAQ